jgi:hypothetical protein
MLLKRDTRITLSFSRIGILLYMRNWVSAGVSSLLSSTSIYSFTVHSMINNQLQKGFDGDYT